MFSVLAAPAAQHMRAAFKMNVVSNQAVGHTVDVMVWYRAVAVLLLVYVAAAAAEERAAHRA